MTGRPSLPDQPPPIPGTGDVWRPPVILKFGGGVETTGLVCGMIERGEKADAVIFSDTGGERDYTYENIARVDVLIRAHGWPGVTTIHYTTRDGNRLTLEQHSLNHSRMPSKSYGRKSCSLRFKKEPSDKWINHWPPAIECWARGERPVMLIGYNVDEVARYTGAPAHDEKFTYDYRLVRWKWGREECAAAAARFGLHPRKSACFFCGSARQSEVLRLRQEAPDLFMRGVRMEDRARPFHGEIVGLGMNFSWRDIGEADAAQVRMFGDQPAPFPCECHEGGDDDDSP